MKGLILFPPQWVPLSPHLAAPAIHAAARSLGDDIDLVDLNIRFFNHVVSRGFLERALQKGVDEFNANARAVFAQAQSGSTPAIREEALRYKRLQDAVKANQHIPVLQALEPAKAALRDAEHFYNPDMVDRAVGVLDNACALLSLCYRHSSVYFLNPRLKTFYDLGELKEACQDAAENVFAVFYEEACADLVAAGHQFIGISIGDYSQLVPGLTLAMWLKQRTQAHICIGGNLFGRYTDVLIRDPDFFAHFAHSIIHGEGEKPLRALLTALKDGTPLAQVPNMIHVDETGAVICTEEQPPLALKDLPPPDFSGLDEESYLLPERIFNIQSSRNCYWNKCSFCTHHFGSRFAVKPQKVMVDELEHLGAAHGARYFHFVDEAMSPPYLRRLSEEIIARGLDIRFYVYARLEELFDRPLMELAYRAGLRMVMWGFESANERIYELMNKSGVVSKEGRLRILQDTHAAGVWNHLFVMFDFPTETLEEAKETVDFLAENATILSHSTGSMFVLQEGSPILSDLPRFRISEVERVRNGFSYAHRFKVDGGMSAEDKKELQAYKTQAWGLDRKRFARSAFREKAFLYACHHGVAAMARMRESMWM